MLKNPQILNISHSPNTATSLTVQTRAFRQRKRKRERRKRAKVKRAKG